MNRSAHCFSCVSVVMIAREKAYPPSRDSSSVARAASSFSIGSIRPMTPVEPTSTSPLVTPKRAPASEAMRSQSVAPCVPVTVFAFPELQMTLRTSERVASTFWLWVTEWPVTAFCVNTPAATPLPPSIARRPRSRRGSAP